MKLFPSTICLVAAFPLVVVAADETSTQFLRGQKPSEGRQLTPAGAPAHNCLAQFVMPNDPMRAMIHKDFKTVYWPLDSTHNQDDKFWLRPCLDTSSLKDYCGSDLCVSLEAYTWAGWYLFHENFQVKLGQASGIQAKDASFCLRPHGASSYELESISWQNYFFQDEVDVGVFIRQNQADTYKIGRLNCGGTNLGNGANCASSTSNGSTNTGVTRFQPVHDNCASGFCREDCSDSSCAYTCQNAPYFGEWCHGDSDCANLGSKCYAVHSSHTNSAYNYAQCTKPNGKIGAEGACMGKHSVDRCDEGLYCDIYDGYVCKPKLPNDTHWCASDCYDCMSGCCGESGQTCKKEGFPEKLVCTSYFTCQPLYENGPGNWICRG